MSPVVIASTANEMTVGRVEALAPITCVQRVGDDDEALAVANDGEFGSTTGIMTCSLVRASHFRADCVMVNLPVVGIDHHVPFAVRAVLRAPRAGLLRRRVLDHGRDHARRRRDALMGAQIDGRQEAGRSEKVLRQMREGGVGAAHVTITDHGTFRETALVTEARNRPFGVFPGLILRCHIAAVLAQAQETRRTAILFGARNPSCIEDDVGLVEVLRALCPRLMQLIRSDRSPLASGC